MAVHQGPLGVIHTNTVHVLVSRAGMLVATPASSLSVFIKGVG